MTRWGRWTLGVCVLGAAVTALSVARARLVDRFTRLRQTADTYALPPPDQVVVASLGHRSALADLVYAHTLVSYGLHFGEKRRFEYVGAYLDTITTLDPDFAQPYLYADTLLTLQPEPPRQQDYEKARELLLKGTRRLPYHQHLWFTAGQYLAYLAPPHLEDEALRESFKRDGARLLARACELATDNEAIPFHCLTAAGMLNSQGERAALIQMLLRTLAVNDDEEIHRQARATLAKWVGQEEEEAYARRSSAFVAEWQRSLPHVSKEKLLLMGPAVDVLACTGRDRSGHPGCRTTFRAWAEAFSESRASRP